MSDFKSAFDKMLVNEGGYVNNPNDRGGETYKGISRVFNPSWTGWQLLDKIDDKNNINNPILDEAVELFYLENYWNKLKCDNIASDLVAFELFDTSVNMGVKGGTKLMQMVVEAKQDGIIGVNTLNSINSLDEELLILRFKLAKVASHAYLVKKRPKNKVFLLGWINRVLGA